MFGALVLLTVSSLSGFTKAQLRCATECEAFFRITAQSEACQSQPNSLECVTDTCAAADTFEVCFPCLGLSQTDAAQSRELCQNSGGSAGGGGGISSSGGGATIAPSASSSSASTAPSGSASDCNDVCREVHRAINQSAACDRDPKSASCFRDLCVASSTFRECLPCLEFSEGEIDTLEKNCASLDGGGGGGGGRSRPSSSQDDLVAGSTSSTSPTRSSDPSPASSTVTFGPVSDASSSADAPSTTIPGPSPSQSPALPGSNAQRTAFPIGGALLALGLAALF